MRNQWITIATLLLIGQAPRLAAAPGDTVFMIQIDGARFATVSRLLQRGKLPHLQRLLQDRSGRTFAGISSFPSSTAPSLPELLVGRYSDRCAPDLLRRVQGFDRTTGRIDRYEFVRKAWNTSDIDLFDLVAQQGRRSFSYFEGEFRGASVNDFNPLSYRLEFATGYAKLPMPNYDRQVIDEVLRDITAERPPPALVFIGLGAADIAGHSRGPSRTDYARALQENDTQLGRLIARIKKLPHPKGGTLYQHSAFFIFGDHGMADTQQHIDLGRVLNNAGIITADGANLGAMLQATLVRDWYKNVDAVTLGIGSNIAELQLRRRGDSGQRMAWGKRPTLADMREMPVGKGRGHVDVVSLLLGQPGIGMVLAPVGPGQVLLFTPGGGEALVAREGTPKAARRFAYQVRRRDERGRDPLGYLSSPQARTLVTPAHMNELVFHNARRWFNATVDGEHPYAPALIPKAFDAVPTAPDLIVLAKSGAGFLPVVRGDHGNLDLQSMLAFVAVAGVDFDGAPADRARIRLIDLHAEVRRYLGIAAEPKNDSQGFAWYRALPDSAADPTRSR